MNFFDHIVSDPDAYGTPEEYRQHFGHEQPLEFQRIVAKAKAIARQNEINPNPSPRHT